MVVVTVVQVVGLVACCVPLSCLRRSLRDLGVPENWLAMWLNLVYVLETVN